jgi:hypothetical protein
MGKSLPELQKILEDATKLKLIALIDDLDVNVNKVISDNLKQIIGVALGFDTRWSQWETKADSPITRAIGELALAQIKLIFPDFLERVIADEEFKSKLDAAITRNYEYHYKRKITEQVETWMGEEAHRRSSVIINALKPPEEKK